MQMRQQHSVNLLTCDLHRGERLLQNAEGRPHRVPGARVDDGNPVPVPDEKGVD